jgi:hypothetical protein
VYLKRKRKITRTRGGGAFPRGPKPLFVKLKSSGRFGTQWSDEC